MEPKIVREFKWSALFGRISFFYVLEDRRPDLIEAHCIKKYKLLVMFRCFGLTVSTVNHTNTPGFLFVNGKEQ